MNKDYNKQALQFLADTNTTLEIVKAERQTAPLWVKGDQKHGIQYKCTLKNANHTYTFDFWDSIKDAEIINAINNLKPSYIAGSENFQAERLLKKENIKFNPQVRMRQEAKNELIARYMPTEYDILACLSPLYENDFQDFCDAFGYDSDSMTGLKTFEAVKEQDRNLRILWDRAELEALAEIQ